MRVNGAALCAMLLLQACFFEPGRPGNSPSDGAVDGHGDGSGSGSGSGAAPHARLIQDAYFCGASGSTGMTGSGYAIPTTGISNGDLVLFLANIDNGSNSIFALPPGFTKLYEAFWDVTFDGQTFVAGYKIVTNASNEDISYSAPYGSGLASGCAVIMLVAVTGYDPANPIDAKVDSMGTAATNPVILRGRITTTRPNDLLVLAGGADWLSDKGSNDNGGDTSFDPPPNFTLIDGLSDYGGAAFLWTSQLVATRVAATVGDTNAEDGHLMPTTMVTGTPWTVELAIAPAP